jgi:hypothetical protein
MLETFLGSGSPMWTAVPSSGFAFQAPIAIANRPIASPVFGSPAIPGFASGVSPVAQGLQAPNFGAPFPFAPNPLAALIGADPTAGITAPALLAAVAMRRGQPQGPTNEQEVEDFIYDALELLPGAADVEVRWEGGRVTLSGTVQHKRVKRDVGEIAWAIPGLNDVQNNVTITSRRRARANREAETSLASASPGRKQS